MPRERYVFNQTALNAGAVVGLSPAHVHQVKAEVGGGGVKGV